MESCDCGRHCKCPLRGLWQLTPAPSMNETASPTQGVLTLLDLRQSDRGKLVSQLVFICISLTSAVQYFFHKFKIHVSLLSFPFLSGCWSFAVCLFSRSLFDPFLSSTAHSWGRGRRCLDAALESGMNGQRWSGKWVHFLGGCGRLRGCGVPEPVVSGLTLQAPSETTALTQAESRCPPVC